jgi:hypothetical protein
VDRTLLNHLLKMFTALGIYAESFEKPFLECTSEFYAAEGMKYMQQSDVPDYLKHVEVHIVPPPTRLFFSLATICDSLFCIDLFAVLYF